MTSSFSDLQLAEPLLHALADRRYETPTPIQSQAIPHLLLGRDLLGVAQTGTGKTAAFALPILQLLSRTPAERYPRALVLTPTRELAVQIGESFRAYGRHLSLRHATVFGGVGQGPQIAALARGVDVLVATPGRLLDLMSTGHVRFHRLSVFVLDEADRMLDMGFMRDVKRIIAALPAARQTLLFSATMPDDIAHLAAGILVKPIRVEATPVASTVERIDQRVLFVQSEDKRSLLRELLDDPKIARALVFARTKHGANRLAEQLARSNISAEAFHSNKSQSARQRALDDFRTGRVRVLVATDIAARGIDIDGITHVINFDLPNVPESYVHRIGRTARAGAAGIALSFCDGAERSLLRDIEKLTRHPLSVVEDHPYAGRAARPRESASAAPASPRGHRAAQQRPAGKGRPHQGRPSGPARTRHASADSLRRH